MLSLTRIESGTKREVSATLALTLDQRSRARLRVTLDDGTDAGLFLSRGGCLRDGDLLASEEGIVVRVIAAPEPVCLALSDDALLLARACYHLGNRHVPLQIDPGRIRFPQDHVLEEMIRGLGLETIHELAPFQPEQGAYAGAGHHRHD